VKSQCPLRGEDFQSQSADAGQSHCVWLVRLRLASLAYGEASSATRAEEPQDAWKSKATRRKRSRAKASRDDKVVEFGQAL